MLYFFLQKSPRLFPSVTLFWRSTSENCYLGNFAKLISLHHILFFLQVDFGCSLWFLMFACYRWIFCSKRHCSWCFHHRTSQKHRSVSSTVWVQPWPFSTREFKDVIHLRLFLSRQDQSFKNWIGRLLFACFCCWWCYSFLFISVSQILLTVFFRFCLYVFMWLFLTNQTVR